MFLVCLFLNILYFSYFQQIPYRPKPAINWSYTYERCLPNPDTLISIVAPNTSLMMSDFVTMYMGAIIYFEAQPNMLSCCHKYQCDQLFKKMMRRVLKMKFNIGLLKIHVFRRTILGLDWWMSESIEKPTKTVLMLIMWLVSNNNKYIK